MVFTDAKVQNKTKKLKAWQKSQSSIETTPPQIRIKQKYKKEKNMEKGFAIYNVVFYWNIPNFFNCSAVKLCRAHKRNIGKL